MLIYLGLPHFKADTQFCSDKDMQAYIATNKYQVHACEELRQSIANKEVCQSFVAAVPPPVEVPLTTQELQIANN